MYAAIRGMNYQVPWPFKSAESVFMACGGP